MRRAAIVIAAAALLLVAYVLLRATHPEPVATLARAATPRAAPLDPTPRAATSAADLRAALVSLDDARRVAYADPVTADPDTWADRTCPCYAEDARRLRALAARHQRLRGQRTTLISLTATRAGPSSADLLVTDTTSAYAAVDARGHTVARWPASSQRWRITLRRVGGRWLLGAVARAP